MNIKQAKTEIASTIRAYRLRDAQGNLKIPRVRQRPILLMGPPGIGKTAVLKQVAEECGVGLCSYSLTHHTRQSAVGLPRMETVNYQGQEMTVTRYTVSEIIASLYTYMENTGKTEGILFLDEVNCVSETLAPTMLELLQNKTFGSHAIPEGWILVTAGNPPQYNKAVREFDIATLDRVRTIPVEADCPVWLEYAQNHQVHGAILSYLAIRPEHFYQVEDGISGKSFVTARGWEDLSGLLGAYEELQIPVTQQVVSQYLQQEEVAKGFAAYYQLYRKYHTDYGISALLEGNLSEEEREIKVRMAEKGGFEERFTVIQLLVDGLSEGFSKYMQERKMLEMLRDSLQRIKSGGTVEQLAETMEKSLQALMQAGLAEDQAVRRAVICRLEQYGEILKQEHIWEEKPGFQRVSQLLSQQVQAFEEQADRQGRALERAIAFAEECFGEGQEMVLLMTELTRSEQAMAYITQYGSDLFMKHSEALRFRSQEQKLMAQCRSLREGI